jgi:hypothetical protein
MSETIPGYGALPKAPLIDLPLLRGRIAMYLHGRSGDEQGRRLLEDCELALIQAEGAALAIIDAKMDRLMARIEPVLQAVEAMISDGK